MSLQNPALTFLANEFCVAISSVFEQTAGAPYILESVDGPDGDKSVEILDFVMTFSGAIVGTMLARVDLQSAAQLANSFLGDESGSKADYVPEHGDAVSEIVSQTSGVIATSLRRQFGNADITVEQRTCDSSSFTTLLLRTKSANTDVQIKVFCDPGLLDSVTRTLAERDTNRTGNGQATTPDREGESVRSAPGGFFGQQNLHIIMDVELALTLRFGQRVLALSEVADLTSGSVVELDRDVDEPVELLLGDRVIARGEVVIVDGNYGLRITEMAAVDRASLLSA